MVLNNIANLIHDMMSRQLLRQKFTFTYNNRTVEVMIFTDNIPFKLLVGVYSTDCSVNLDINKYGKIDAMLQRSIYAKLYDALGINSSNPGAFKTTDFFLTLDKHSPLRACPKAIVLPQDRFKYDHDIEETDKIFFCGYQDNTGTGHVSNPNYKKTCKAFGKEIACFLRQKNISTRWTNREELEVKFFRPRI